MYRHTECINVYKDISTLPKCKKVFHIMRECVCLCVSVCMFVFKNKRKIGGAYCSLLKLLNTISIKEIILFM